MTVPVFPIILTTFTAKYDSQGGRDRRVFRHKYSCFSLLHNTCTHIVRTSGTASPALLLSLVNIEEPQAMLSRTLVNTEEPQAMLSRTVHQHSTPALYTSTLHQHSTPAPIPGRTTNATAPRRPRRQTRKRTRPGGSAARPRLCGPHRTYGTAVSGW